MAFKNMREQGCFYRLSPRSQADNPPSSIASILHHTPLMHKRLIIGISGASGALYGVRLLELLKETDIETHVVVSKAALITLKEETSHRLSDVQSLSDFYYQPTDIAAAIASGSFQTMGMIVAPCSMRSLAEIATSMSSSLLSRAADVILKERKKLVLMVRETPLTTVHLRHMVTVSEMGAIIAPPVPAFYNHPESIDDIVNHATGRVLDLFDIETSIVKRWQ